ncbi:MAG: hypothetical protein V2I39_11510 [Erythrobacter sp.]|jgi:hypothetical protein|nr:hypothetical protein [Erythrobacter sp.]
MKVIAWLVGGFVLLTLSGVVEAVGDTGATPGERLPLYFAALGMLLGAGACFVLGIRSAFKGVFGRKKADPARSDTAPARPATRIDPVEAQADLQSDFDPDAALARYLAKRSADAPAPPEAQARTGPKAGGFGRKGLTS